jgi:DNA-binding GntR family transcriptional regulator
MKTIKENLSDRIAQELRYSILRGERSAGQHLVENNLTAEMGVSNGPIREALTRLESEGFVSTLTNGRTLVNVVDEKFLDDYLEVSHFFLYSSIGSIIDQAANGRDISEIIENMDTALNLWKVSIDKKNDKGITLANEAMTSPLVLAAGNHVICGMWKSMDGMRKTLFRLTKDFYEKTSSEFKVEIYENMLALRNGIAVGDKTKITACLNKQYDYRRRGFWAVIPVMQGKI